jgi:Heparan-alpha-glucosaminide N-acetyltransferase, catalytic
MTCLEDKGFSGRLNSIDQLRALAIISMMIAHFGPGVLDRFPALAPFADPILFCGRFATVTFILVFGITVGFVYHDRFHSGERERIRFRLLARAALVLLFAVIISIPGYLALWSQGSGDPLRWLLATYSVLSFYVLALVSAPVWLMMLGRNPLRNALLLGISYWLLSAALLATWSGGDALTVREFVRFVLISGPFAYIQLAGCALMAVPVGLYLRRALDDGTLPRYLVMLLSVGVGLTAVGYFIGRWTDEFDFHAIVLGTVKAPPRTWYWMFFGGPALLALLGLVALETSVRRARQWLYPLSLFGQGALPIYTAHAYVLPLLALLDQVIVLKGAARFVVPLAAFGLFCGMVMFYYDCKRQKIISKTSGTSVIAAGRGRLFGSGLQERRGAE